jgi:hypothetical protein
LYFRIPSASRTLASSSRATRCFSPTARAITASRSASATATCFWDSSFAVSSSCSFCLTCYARFMVSAICRSNSSDQS